MTFLTQAVTVLRQVVNNPGKAEQLQQHADDLEEAIAKEFAEKSSHVVLFQLGDPLDASREDVAVIGVSQTLESLGTIQTANVVAQTMFGYSKRDLIGKNISIIVPEPMGAMHDTYMQAFVATGRSVSCSSKFDYELETLAVTGITGSGDSQIELQVE